MGDARNEMLQFQMLHPVILHHPDPHRRTISDAGPAASRAGVIRSYTEPVSSREVDAVLDQIRAHGGRITTARRLVIGALLDAHGHVGAEDIAATIREDHPEVHLTTVYRTLESLTEMGIVAHTHVGHGAAVYHLGELHQHLACDVCGALTDVPVTLLDDLRATLERDHGFILHVGHFALLGRCAHHDAKGSAPATH